MNIKNAKKLLKLNKHKKIKKLKIPPQRYNLGKIERINFRAFFSSSVANVLGATIAAKKIRLPKRKGSKKLARL